MNWALEHLQFILAAAGAVAWWLNQRRQAQNESGETPPAEETFKDPELADRTRRIREEIQRKIEQRTGGRPLAPMEPPPELPPILRNLLNLPEPPKPAPVPAPAAQREAQRQSEILAQQAALAEQLRLVKELKAAAQQRHQFEMPALGAEAAAAQAVRGALSEDLRDPAALRRAFILREVLGPPVALRQ